MDSPVIQLATIANLEMEIRMKNEEIKNLRALVQKVEVSSDDLVEKLTAKLEALEALGELLIDSIQSAIICPGEDGKNQWLRKALEVWEGRKLRIKRFWMKPL